MGRAVVRPAAAAALLVLAGQGAALAFGGGGSSGEGDGRLRQELQNPRSIEPGGYADPRGTRRNGPGGAYEAGRRGGPIYGEWGWRSRY